jgi:hypothetical protein
MAENSDQPKPPIFFCANHPRRSGIRHCKICDRNFCEECAQLKKFQNSIVALCPTCHYPLIELAPYVPVPPFWKSAGSILPFPFQGSGRLLFIIWPILAAILRGIPMFFILTIDPEMIQTGVGQIAGFGVQAPFYAILYLCLLPLFYQIIINAENGEFHFSHMNFDLAVQELVLTPLLQVLGPF